MTTLAYVGQLRREHIDAAEIEVARTEPPIFDTVEEFFAWQREFHRARLLADEPHAATAVVALADREIAILIRAFGPIKLITPFGVVVLAEKPHVGD